MKTTTSKPENKNLVVYGIFQSEAAAQRCVELLKARSFRNSDISLLLPTGAGTREFAHTNSTKAPEGAALGSGSGAIVGGALGWLAGIGTLAIPGFGPFIAAGPLMALLAGAGAGGMVGGVTGALIGFGVPEYEAKRYEGRVKEGGILLSVHADREDWRERAREVLEECGAEDISESQEESADAPASDRASLHNY